MNRDIDICVQLTGYINITIEYRLLCGKEAITVNDNLTLHLSKSKYKYLVAVFQCLFQFMSTENISPKSNKLNIKCIQHMMDGVKILKAAAYAKDVQVEKKTTRIVELFIWERNPSECSHQRSAKNVNREVNVR